MLQRENTLRSSKGNTSTLCCLRLRRSLRFERVCDEAMEVRRWVFAAGW